MVTMETRSVVSICLLLQVATPGIIPWAEAFSGLKSLGEHHIIGNPHIVGGDDAEPHGHPYQVALLLDPDCDIDDGGFCGGSLLSDIWVVTAAHCTDFEDSIMKKAIIIAGAHRIKELESMTQKLSIQSVHPHPKWNNWTLKNDISLIRLSTPANLNKYIQPIRLPSQQQKNHLFSHQTVTLTGWGVVTDGNSSMAPKLQEVQTNTISNFFCSLSFFFMRVSSSNICVSGWHSKGSCYGDSGGPMTIEESDGIRTLIGITSYGSMFGCEKLWPSVYTRVTSYLDWIHSNTGIPKRT